MVDFAKRADVIKYFKSIKNELQYVKIKSIFSFDERYGHSPSGVREYNTAEDVFILLENGNALVINYRYINTLDIQLRQLTQDEINEYDDLLIKDYFNAVINVYDAQTKEIKSTEICELEYGSILNVFLDRVKVEYTKWKNNDLVFVEPTEETFCAIKFIMSNGKTFVISPLPAESGGDTRIFSEDANETIIYR